MGAHVQAICKATGLDMRQADQAALAEVIIRDHADVEYPTQEAMIAAFIDARGNRSIPFQGSLAHHKAALKSILETLGVNFNDSNGRKTANDMKELVESKGITLDNLADFVEKNMVGF